MGCSPTVAECDGDYNHDSRKNLLQWNLPIIDATNKSGSLEFNAPHSIPGDFFPVNITFTSKIPYADMRVKQVAMVDDESPAKFSTETILYTERYEVV